MGDILMMSAGVQKLLGVTNRQLQHWDEQGLATPTKNREGKNNRSRAYNATAVRKVMLVRDLASKGLTGPRLQKVVGVAWRAMASGSRFVILCFGPPDRILLSDTIGDLMASLLQCRRCAVVSLDPSIPSAPLEQSTS